MEPDDTHTPEESTVRSAQDREAPPEQIGPYRILEVLGEGGMGTVYLAEQERPVRRRVALKIIKIGMDTREVIARFESERQALAMMNHPSIARVFDAGSTDTRSPYFVMEHVPGIPITEYCDRHRLTLRERLELFIPVCRAVHHAHQRGIIHRDLKPSNVLVAVLDGVPTPKIIDFGVAKATSQRLTERTVFTEQGRLIGTPEYMSPEQAEMSAAGIDTTSDVYSLGVMLYEILVGALPFDSRALREAGLLETYRIIVEIDPPKPSTRVSALGAQTKDIARRRRLEPRALHRRIRGELDWITMRAMEKDPRRRYPAASELAADIERCLRGEAIAAGPPSATYRLKKGMKRHRTLFISAVVVFAALAIGFAFSVAMYIRAETARVMAEEEARKSEQVVQFLQGMFASVDPEEARGREVTVREILDEAARDVGTGLADQPEIQAAVQNTIGSTYRALGLYEDAERHLRAGLLTRERTVGRNHPDFAASLNQLAVLMRQKGSLDSAAALHRRALEINRRSLGEEHPRVAESLNNLGVVLWMQGEYAEAEVLFREGLALTRSLHGGEHPHVATDIGNLALLLQDAGKSDEAEACHREALALSRRLYDGDHPTVANHLDNLASFLHGEGNYSEAAQLSQEALEMRRRLLGDEHPDIALNLNNLASILGRMDRNEEAEELYRQALEIWRTALGDAHPDIATALHNLAGALQAQGEFTEAEALYHEALAMRRELLGEDHPRVALTWNNLGSLLRDQKKYAEAEPVYREALARCRAALGEEHPLVAYPLLGLATVRTELGDAQQAEPLVRECLSIRRQHYDEKDWRIALAENCLGHCLAAQGRFAEAESLLLKSHRDLESSESASEAVKRESISRLVRLYEVWGKAEQVATFRERVEGGAR